MLQFVFNCLISLKGRIQKYKNLILEENIEKINFSIQMAESVKVIDLILILLIAFAVDNTHRQQSIVWGEDYGSNCDFIGQDIGSFYSSTAYECQGQCFYNPLRKNCTHFSFSSENQTCNLKYSNQIGKENATYQSNLECGSVQNRNFLFVYLRFKRFEFVLILIII